MMKELLSSVGFRGGSLSADALGTALAAAGTGLQKTASKKGKGSVYQGVLMLDISSAHQLLLHMGPAAVQPSCKRCL
jgi:hypothetical protein